MFVTGFVYWPVILTRFMSGRIFCLISVDVLSDSSLVSPGSLVSSTSATLDGSDGMSVLMSSERCRSVTDQPTVGANRAGYSETKPLLLRIFVYTG
jgi:hypothetical protein